MTGLGPRPVPQTLSHDALGSCLSRVVTELDAHVLVEGGDGQVVRHSCAEHPVPDPLVPAIVHGSVARLGLVDRRTAGVLPGGPVTTARLSDGSRVAVVPLPTRQGWLWACGAATPEVSLLAEAARRVASALDAPARDVLHDALVVTGELPRDVLGTGPRWLLVSSDPVPQEIRRGALVTAVDGRCFALTGVSPESLPDVHGVVAGPLDESTDLAALRRSLEHALDRHRGDGTTRLDEVRSALVLDRLAEHLDPVVPGAPADALAPLLAQADLQPAATTLLAWLEAHGDCAAAARALDIHVNTFRYRMNRLRERLDLDDPDVRLEAHLRLRDWARHRSSGAGVRLERSS